MSDLGPLPTLHDELVVFWIARVFAYSIHHELFFLNVAQRAVWTLFKLYW